MNNFFAGVDVGRKNVVLGVLLFLALGVLAGVPLTVDLFGGSMLGETQYQTWKVLHAYGVFTAFVNFFFGFLVDRMNLGGRQLEIARWSFFVAGLVAALAGHFCSSSLLRRPSAATPSPLSRPWGSSLAHSCSCGA